MKSYVKFSIILCAFLFAPTQIFAQKGTGENEGVGRQRLDVAVAEVSGELIEIKTGPCENTTGKSPYGSHLIVKTKHGIYNIHLGPTTAVDHVVNQLVIGSNLRLEVFRSERLPENSYIAKSIFLDDKDIHLRDNFLRPSWAYGGRGQGSRRKLEKRGPCW